MKPEEKWPVIYPLDVAQKASSKISSKRFEYMTSFRDHEYPEDFKKQTIDFVKSRYDELTSGWSNLPFTLDVDRIDKAAYLEGWNLARSGGNKILRTDDRAIYENWPNSVADESLVEGYADALLLDFVENFKSESKQIPESPAQIAEQKPMFKSESIQTIYDLLNNSFQPDQRPMFLRMLESGDDAGNPLTFLDSGNRLADAFKQLFESDFISGIQKKDLQKWIAKNFRFVYRNNVKTFTDDYIDKCISRKGFPCKNPFFRIIKGKIEKI